MKKRNTLPTNRILGGVLLLALVGSVASAQSTDSDVVYGRNFTLGSVDLRVAEAWYWELCEEIAENQRCVVTQAMGSNPAMLSVEGPSRVHAAFARRLAERDLGRQSQEFQILLVEASRQGNRMDQELPAHAREALADVAEFLPFSAFSLIDSGWMKTSGRGQVDLSSNDGTRYEVSLAFDPKLTLEGVVLEIGRFNIRAQYRLSAPHVPGEDESRTRMLISSTLTLEIGETAVVGTSKLNGGDKALIVLLTVLE